MDVKEGKSMGAGDVVTTLIHMLYGNECLTDGITHALQEVGQHFGLQKVYILEVSQTQTDEEVTFMWSLCEESKEKAQNSPTGNSLAENQETYRCEFYDDGTYRGAVIYEGISREVLQAIEEELRSVTELLSMYLVKERNLQAMVQLKEEVERAYQTARKANEAKTAFLSRMSHDIRTPINGILGMFEIDERHPENEELLRENRIKSKHAIKQLLSLVNDVLDMCNLEDESEILSYEAFNVRDIYQDSVTIAGMRAEQRGIVIHETEPEEFQNSSVYGSSMHVRQILVNIIDNAVKFSNENGVVDVACETKALDERHIAYTFTISDNGIGMSDDFMKVMFEPFSQEENGARTEYAGTGLGLSITKKLVEKMNGTLEIQSEIGKGTRVQIMLPFEIDQNQNLYVCDSEEVSLEGMKLLLVEDNELNLEIAQFLLEDAGAMVTVARDGVEAVEIFQKMEIGTFDVILMDIMMPNMDGITAAKMIRGMARRDSKVIPIIAMTANAFADDVRKTREAGMDEHLTKPLDVDRMLRTISKYRGGNLAGRGRINYDRYPLDETILSELRKLDISFVFQPIFYADGSRVFAYEALMRPRNTTITELIYRYAKEGKLHILEVATIFGATQAHLERGYKEAVSINSFPSEAFTCQEHEAFVRYFNMTKQRAILEILEYNKLDTEAWIRKSEHLKNSNVKVSLDDFGTGESTMDAVKVFDPQIIKIDRSLISHIDSDKAKQEKVTCLVTKFHKMDKKVVGEGVETKEECEFLRSIGIDFLQGYYLGMPE